MGEAVPRWRRAPETAQDPRGLESSGVPGVLPQNTATNPALGGYQEPPKLSYSPGLPTDKGCPWRGSEGCAEPAGFPLGCPYPPAPQRLRDALCHPKDSSELPLLLAPRNGQPKEPPPGGLKPCWPPWLSTATRTTATPCPSPPRTPSAPASPAGTGTPRLSETAPSSSPRCSPPLVPKQSPDLVVGGRRGPWATGASPAPSGAWVPTCRLGGRSPSTWGSRRGARRLREPSRGAAARGAR